MITHVNLSLFSSNELLTLAKGTNSIADAKKTKLTVIVPFLTNAVQKTINFQSALERESKNPLTKKQSGDDNKRNLSFLAYRDYCQSAESRRKEGWTFAAGKILNVIHKHGWSAQLMGYKAKTAAITKMTSEIREKYPNELMLINAGEWLQELEADELDFENTAQEVVKVASASHEPVVADTRPEVIDALKALYQTVTLQQIAAPSADLDELTAQLNELISTSLATVRASDTRAENIKIKNAPAPN